MTDVPFNLSDELHHAAAALAVRRIKESALPKCFRVCAEAKPRFVTTRRDFYIPAGTTKEDLDRIFGKQATAQPAPNEELAIQVVAVHAAAALAKKVHPPANALAVSEIGNPTCY